MYCFDHHALLSALALEDLSSTSQYEETELTLQEELPPIAAVIYLSPQENYIPEPEYQLTGQILDTVVVQGIDVPPVVRGDEVANFYRSMAKFLALD
jgi:hypothetical protein